MFLVDVNALNTGLLFLCAVKSELTYSDLNRVLKVSEILKELLYQFHTLSEFLWLSSDLNPGFLSPSPSLYPLIIVSMEL